MIPATSRLYADIRKAMDIARSTETQEELFSRLWAAFGQYNWVDIPTITPQPVRRH